VRSLLHSSSVRLGVLVEPSSWVVRAGRRGESRVLWCARSRRGHKGALTRAIITYRVLARW
jgi:hypothetical protein